MRSLLLLSVVCLTSAVQPLRAQESSPAPSATPIVAPYPADADAATATRAWLNTVPAEQHAKSDAYFEGGYWLILWNLILGAAIALLLLNLRISARMRDFAERTTRFKALQVAIYGIIYVLLVALLESPLNIYEHYFREHAYGLSNQTFGAWLGEQGKGLIVMLIAISVLLALLYTVFRRAPRTWWIWGTAVMVAFLIFGAFIAPVFVEPLFNKYKPLTDANISEPILAMARANEIPVTQVFEVDASRQSKRISANVAGVFGTTRIALNDNLLKQCSVPEIRAVMAHEMGHFVLNHIYKFVIMISLVWLISFAIARRAFEAAVRRWGDRWQVRGIADPAGLPLLALIAAVLGFLATPITNTIIRVQEREADAFGLNTAREPDAMSVVALKLGTYRKLDPGPWEEAIFFDHPSGRARIRMSMDWKAAHLPAGEETR